jgi:Flp pilus assembly protein protease CpaA
VVAALALAAEPVLLLPIALTSQLVLAGALYLFAAFLLRAVPEELLVEARRLRGRCETTCA